MSTLDIPFKPAEDQLKHFRERINNYAKVVQEESWDVKPNDIPIEQRLCRQKFRLMATLAGLYRTGCHSKHPFAWRASAEFVRMMLVTGVRWDIRSYNYYVVFGLGDREVDAPFEQGDQTRTMIRDLMRMACNDQVLLTELKGFLGDEAVERELGEFAAWRKRHPLHLSLSKAVTAKERCLTPGESERIRELKTSVIPPDGSRNWTLRVPTAAERTRASLPLEAVWLTYRDFNQESAAYRLIIDNPELVDLEPMEEEVGARDDVQRSLIEEVAQ